MMQNVFFILYLLFVCRTTLFSGCVFLRSPAKALCTPLTGVNLWGESPLCLNPFNFVEHSLPNYGPVIWVKRPVRTRLPVGVGAGGEKPPATRFGGGDAPFLIWLILGMLNKAR